MKNRRFILNKNSGRIVAIRSRNIKGLIEHKIIRARKGTAAILFERFKALFFRTSSQDWTETREQLLGPCYPNPKSLLPRDLLLLLVPSTTLSYEDKLHPWAIDDMARSLHYTSPTMCWNCTSRGLLPKFCHFPKSFSRKTFSRSASLDRRRTSIRVDANCEIRLRWKKKTQYRQMELLYIPERSLLNIKTWQEDSQREN